MRETPLGCVLPADRHCSLTEGVRGLLETAFGAVIMVADVSPAQDGAGSFVLKRAIATDPLPTVACSWLPDVSRAEARPSGWRSRV